MKNKIFFVFLLLLSLATVQCKKDKNNNPNSDNPTVMSDGVWIINQGAFGHGNASLDFLTRQGQLHSGVFKHVNNRPLGDVFQSMILYNDNYYLVINNSQRIEVANRMMQSTGAIEGLGSPREMLPINPHKAYVTDLSSNGIWIVDPTAKSKIDKIDYAPHGGSYNSWTEHIIQYENTLFITAPNVKQTLELDVQTDKIIDSIQLQGEPDGMVQDKDQNIWVITNGYYFKDSSELYCISPKSRKIVKSFPFPSGKGPSLLAINKTADSLYYIYDNNLMRISISANGLPAQPYISLPAGSWDGLGIDPKNGDIYLADAGDYKSNGKIYRYDASGILKGSWNVGIVPAGFYFIN